MQRFTMWTLLFLCSVLTAQGVQGYTSQRDTTGYSTSTTEWGGTTSVDPSCRSNCGKHLGSCSCSITCQYYGNCCYDYYYNCPSTTTGYTTETIVTTTAQATGATTAESTTTYAPTYAITTIQPDITLDPSCRSNCGKHLGSCSCSSSCQYYGNCCYDYYHYCPVGSTASASTAGVTTTGHPSCRYNCGYHLGSCSCSSSCQSYGNCCYDYYHYCPVGSTASASTAGVTTTGHPSCRYNCGYHLGSCSCSSSCQSYGNCCYDYYRYCPITTTIGVTTTESTATTDITTTGHPSCRYNCGYHMGSCSCSSSCQYYGNCCYDYYHYCPIETTTYYPATTSYSTETTGQPSCLYNCGYHLGSCSCSSNCQYYGNCCYDYYHYCPSTTTGYTTEKPCGGYLFGSGTFSSPNHPNYYNDNDFCVWQLKAAHNQRVFLAFTSMQLENCCNCDYIEVYNGPSTSYPYMGRVCNQNLTSFHSSSTYLTVKFRTDGSVVGRGFKAEFMSSLQPSSGRVTCSSDEMKIVIEKSYLNSLGYEGHNLYLNDQYCRPTIHRYQVVFNFHINSCGNEKQFENGRVVYTNNLRGYTSSSSDGEITRQNHLKLNISCIMDKDSVSQNVFVVQHDGNSTIIGDGKFNTTMTFYTSSNFYYPVTQYPYEVGLNEDLNVQVDLEGGDSSLVIFLDTCVASPSSTDFHTRVHYLVRNGCTADSTYYPYISGSRNYARFKVKTFQFLRATESVYLQCKVLICQASDYNSRCRRGCRRRRARDLGSQHDSQTVVLGPIILRDPMKKEEGTDKQNKA